VRPVLFFQMACSVEREERTVLMNATFTREYVSRLIISCLIVSMIHCSDAAAAKGSKSSSKTVSNTEKKTHSDMSTIEFLRSCNSLQGETDKVRCKLTQVVRGMGLRESAVDFCILDGTVRCHFPKGDDAAEKYRRYLGCFASVSGVVTGGPGVTASANLENCSLRVDTRNCR